MKKKIIKIYPYNKINIDFKTKKKIRSLFFKKVEIKKIEKIFNLKEWIIRRVIRENNWVNVRERYYRFLCNISCLHNICLKEISKKTGVSTCVLYRIHRKHNIALSKRISWNKKIDRKMEEKFIDEYLNGFSSNDIAKKYGFCRNKSILDVLHKWNLRLRPSKTQTFYNNSFFNKINSCEKAYILGLILTDGWIIRDYSGFGIQLNKDDCYILNKINSLLSPVNRVLNINCDSKRKVFSNTKDMNRIMIYSKEIANDLKNKGVVKNKTKILRYNNCVPKKYLSSFFRGLFDGDGSIGVDRNGYMFVVLSSASRSFLEDLQKTNSLFRFSLTGTKHYYLRISGGTKQMVKFCKWLYNDKSDFYLRRKYAKVQNKIS